MKQLNQIAITSLLLICLPIFCSAQNSSKDIFKKYKKQDKEVMVISVSGLFMKLVPKIGVEPEVRHALNSINNVSIFISDADNQSLINDMKFDFEHLFTKKNYKPLMTVKSDGDIVNFHFLPKTKSKKAELVLLVASDDNEFVALSVRGKFDQNDVKKIAKEININDMKRNM